MTMNRVIAPKTFMKIVKFTNLYRPASSITSQTSQFQHQLDATPEEIDLVNRRMQLKKALRAEYVRKYTDPHSTEPVVFDPQMQRYYSMHMTLTERFVPTFKSWLAYMCTVIIPIVLMAQYLIWSKGKDEKLIRSGQLTYEMRKYRFD